MLNCVRFSAFLFTFLYVLSGWVFAERIAEEESGYVVFVKDYMDQSNHRTLPHPEELGRPLTIFASPGEYKPVSFAVRSNHDLEEVRVSLKEDLKGPGDSVISKDRVEIRIAELMYRWIDQMQYKKLECFLVRNRPIDIPSDYTRRYWLTLHVPYDVVPGNYRTVVQVVPANDEPQEIPLLVEIFPIRLCEPEGMNYFMYFSFGHPIAVPQELRTPEYLRMIYDDMREHGMTTTTVYAYPGAAGWADVNRDRTPQVPMAVQMDLIRDSALVSDWAAIPWIGAEGYGESVWRLVLSEAERRNWPEVLFYIIDEPNEKKYGLIEAAMARLAEFKENNPEYVDVRTTTAGASDPKVSHYYDVWIAGASVGVDTFDRGREMDKEIWVYDCGLGPTDAINARHYYGYWAWTTGIKGASFWAYIDLPAMQNRFGVPGSWRDSERDLIEYKNLYTFVYPASNELIPSIGWEATREGVDDYRYLTTLAKTIELAKEAELPSHLIASAKAVIEEVEASLDVTNFGRIRHEVSVKVGVGNREFDRYPPDEALTNGGYDRLRYQVAQEIIRLNRALESAGKSGVACKPRTKVDHFKPVSRPKLEEIPYTPGTQQSMREALVDSCETLDFWHPTFNQPVWNPPSHHHLRIGQFSVSLDEQFEGTGSLRWLVTSDEMKTRLEENPNYNIAAINRLHGKPADNLAEIKIHVKSENPNRPAVNMMLLGTGTEFNKVILERGEVTDGWKEIVWDISELDLGEGQWGTLLWHIRFWADPAGFQEGDILDIYIDNMRMVTKEEPVDVTEPL